MALRPAPRVFESPMLTTKQRVPPFWKKPNTAWERSVLVDPSTVNSRRNSDQLLMARGSFGNALGFGARPRNAAVLVPTAPIGRGPVLISST